MQAYHRSRHVFNFPSIEEIERNRTGHANGLLGLWVAFKDDDWVRGFGSILYTMDVEPSSVRSLHIEYIARLWSDPETHVNLRAEFLADGVDMIYIVENSGKCDMGVVVNFEIISNFRRAREPWRPNDKQQPPEQVEAHPV